MAQTTSMDQSSPELDALEAFLAANPDEIVAFTEIPFGALLERVNGLGFDGDAIQTELASIGLLDPETWLTPVGLECVDFFELSAQEYADRYPEHGAPLIASILNSIHLDEQQSSLHSLAGGTHLSKGAEYGLIAGGAIITGAYIVPRIYRHLVLRNKLIEIAEKSPSKARDFAKGDYDPDFGQKLTLKKDFLGIYHLDIQCDSWLGRLKMEWNLSYLGKLKRFDIRRNQPDPDVDPDIDNVTNNSDDVSNRMSQDISDTTSEAQTIVESEESHDGPVELQLNYQDMFRRRVVKSVSDDESVRRSFSENLERGMNDPARESQYLAADLSDVRPKIRPKSMDIAINARLDSLVETGLEDKAKSVGGSVLDNVSAGVKDDADSMLDSDMDALSQDLTASKEELKNSLSNEFESAKSELSNQIDVFVDNQVQAAKTVAQTADDDAAQGLQDGAQQFKESVESEGDALVRGAEEKT